MNFLQRLFQVQGGQKTDIQKRFRLGQPIGNGTMSKVWRAVDTQTGKNVALKVLDKEKTLALEKRFAGLDRPREGVIAVKMIHPNIVRTFDHGMTTQDEQFLVMEFLEGVGLQSLIQTQNPQMKTNCLKYCVQLGEALDFFHQQQFIHRDLCPRNMMVTNDGTLKLLDFGLAVPNTAPFRKPGNRTGTAMYMAPELIRRQPTDQRIDIFSYAVSCYEMFTKTFPWPSASTPEAIMQHVHLPPQEIQTLVPKMPDALAKVIMKGLQQDPNQRWQTVREMVNELKGARK
ncbi:MAG TPA: serine/threonine-protein kinase [Planctomicrobium sp.]|nr:serine/threonine-protein kinase [Planctomicrobium sp.]